jgi:hypothetical protein
LTIVFWPQISASQFRAAVESKGGRLEQHCSAPLFYWTKLGSTAKATTINLMRTDVGDQWIAKWANTLQRMERLSLIADDTSISDEEIVLRFSSLVVLSLNNTHVTDELLAGIGLLPELRSLGIANTKVSAEGLSHLSGRSLISLTIDTSQVDEASVESLAALKGLRHIEVWNCSDATTEIIRVLGCSSVVLRGTATTGASLELLESMHGLKTLRLIGTTVPPDDASRFQEDFGVKTYVMSEKEYQQAMAVPTVITTITP